MFGEEIAVWDELWMRRDCNEIIFGPIVCHDVYCVTSSSESSSCGLHHYVRVDRGRMVGSVKLYG